MAHDSNASVSSAYHPSALIDISAVATSIATASSAYRSIASIDLFAAVVDIYQLLLIIQRLQVTYQLLLLHRIIVLVPQ